MLRVRVPPLAEIAGGTIVSATAAADGTSTVLAVGASLFSSTALSTGTCSVAAIGASVFSATAFAAGSATVSAQGSFIGIASTTASASGSATVSAQGKAVGGAASVPTKFARWASYQRRPGTFLRQVSPGVYLRAGKDEAPVVVVNDREIGPAENVRGDRLAGMLAQGLDKRDARKIRKILRRLEELPEPVELPPPLPSTPPQSVEAQKLILQVNASIPKRTVVMAESIDEEIAALVALGII